MTNAELFDGVYLSANGTNQILIADILRFLDGLQSFWEGQNRADLLVLETLREVRDAVAHLGGNIATAPEKYTDARFFTSFGGPLLEQVRAFFEGGTLRLAAPYFGGSVAGVRSLKEKLSPRALKVFPSIHPDGTLDVPLKELTALADTTAHCLALSSVKTFAHLKIYGSDGPNGRWMFTTSANCTQAALGGLNVEAGLMRRVSRPALLDYFAENEAAELPDERRQNDFGASIRWLPFVATSRGTVIEIVTSQGSEVWLPLSDVTLALHVGRQRMEHACSDLFAHGPAQRVPWNWFPGLTTGPISAGRRTQRIANVVYRDDGLAQAQAASPWLDCLSPTARPCRVRPPRANVGSTTAHAGSAPLRPRAAAQRSRQACFSASLASLPGHSSGSRSASQ
jgi:hypothetical protein